MSDEQVDESTGGLSEEIQGETGPAQDGLKSEEKTWAMIAHLSALSGWIGIPFGNILGPLVVYFVKKDESPYVRDHAKEAMNFGISMTIYAIVSALLVLLVIGIFLLAVLVVVAIVLNILAALKANEGRTYKYPFTIRLIS